MTTEDLQPQEISRVVWDDKYRLKNPDGSSNEHTMADSHRRVVDAVYQHDDDDTSREFMYQAMCRQEWCPAGRIHAGAGTGRRVSLINCKVSPTIEDSMVTEKGQHSAGIMDALAVAAYTQQMGCGIGMDFSTLRPEGALVRGVGVASSGPLVFMDMWDAMCTTIRSAGYRRGAMMGTLRCDHPDVLKFARAKREPGRLTNFNVSVLVTDAFMAAVENNLEWDLGFGVPRYDDNHVEVYDKEVAPWYVYDRVLARDLWNQIIELTYDYAEPGVIFIDRINQWNNLWYCETISTTNPCGEQPLPPDGACNLGAINLARLVVDPFTASPTIDFHHLSTLAKHAVRFLDNVLDVTNYPTNEQKQEAMMKRRTGLGVTGLANMLQQLRLRYGSAPAVKVTERVMEVIQQSAYAGSAQLAKERGPFPLYNRDKYLSGRFIKRRLSTATQSTIAEHGIRNGVILTIAPTGTTSIYYDNVSSGLEPTFAWSYDRKVRQPDGSYKTYERVEDYGYRLYKHVHGIEGGDFELPGYMVAAHDLTVDDHLGMQAVCQKYVDASISKTINCPKSMSLDDFKDVYTKAYAMGCKGCTTYRPSDIAEKVRGSILSVRERADPVSAIVDRPVELKGSTYKAKWPASDHAFYVTINDYEEDGKLRPFEIFINTKDARHHEWITALTRSLSAIFRRGGDVSFIVEELQAVTSSVGGAWVGGRYMPSLVALIGKVLEEHLQKIGLIEPGDVSHRSIQAGETVTMVNAAQPVSTEIRGQICPKCNSPTLIHQEGCNVCMSCGYSDCG